jgi:hypothetical protein
VIGCAHATPPPGMIHVLIDRVYGGRNSPTSIMINILCENCEDEFQILYNAWRTNKTVFLQQSPSAITGDDIAPCFALLFLATVSLVTPSTVFTTMERFWFFKSRGNSLRDNYASAAVVQVICFTGMFVFVMYVFGLLICGYVCARVFVR